MKKRILTSILSVMMLLSIIPVQANTITGLETKIKDAKAQVEETKTKIEEAEEEIEKKTDELITISTSLEDLEAEQEEQYQDMKLRIQYMYENGDTDLVVAILTSTDFSEILNRAEMANEVYSYDRKKLEEYITTVNKMKTQEEELENGVAELNSKKEELSTLQKTLEEQIAGDEAELKKLKEEEASKKAQYTSQRPSGTVVKNGNTYQYSASDLDLIYAIVAQECSHPYEGALAVITCACNRAEGSKWTYLGTDPLSQLTAKGQFCYSLGNNYKRYLGGNAPSCVVQAVNDALTTGVRNHPYLSFRSYQSYGSTTNIGGNWYFSHK